MDSQRRRSDASNDSDRTPLTNLPIRPKTDAPAIDEADVRRGVDNNEFVVHYQPAVNLEDRRIASFEALVRWNHPAHGLLGPNVFMDVAERTGLIVEVGDQVRNLALGQTAAWQRAGLDLGLAVNVSGRELVDADFTDRIVAGLDSTGADPTKLWLEVTETVLVEKLEMVGARLRQLAHLGIRVAIDDFGTGWASLLYLRQFPVRALKIDAVFISSVDRSANDTAIVRSVISLGAELGLVVVAEGVERLSQEIALRELGCNIGQGFLYGMPTAAGLAPIDRVNRINTRRSRTADPVLRSDSIPAKASARDDSDAVATMLRGLLRIRSAEGAAHLLQAAVRELGGKLVRASEAGPDALPIDLSLGEGSPLLAEADPMSLARMQLERVLPRLAEDARQGVNLLRYSERLQDQSDHDLLTGLANRRVLDRVLPRAAGGIVIMIDLDHFKHVNDTAGHQAGDAVLAGFGRLLANGVRSTDVCCRLGGEEFVIVAAETDVASAIDLIERLRVAWIDAAPLPVTFSAGLASVGQSGGSVALISADRALYRAKANGRNRTELEITDSVVRP